MKKEFPIHLYAHNTSIFRNEQVSTFPKNHQNVIAILDWRSTKTRKGNISGFRERMAKLSGVPSDTSVH